MNDDVPDMPPPPVAPEAGDGLALAALAERPFGAGVGRQLRARLGLPATGDRAAWVMLVDDEGGREVIRLHTSEACA